jgi:2-hydroxy-3-keto-5-methylthiopentenyl-1-phosphate phosphatase
VYPILSFPNPTKHKLFCRLHKRERLGILFSTTLIYLSFFLEYVDTHPRFRISIITRIIKVYGSCLLLLPAHHLDEFFAKNLANLVKFCTEKNQNFPYSFLLKENAGFEL